MSLEIERKFLARIVGSLPTVSAAIIEQGYLVTGEPQEEELRIRVKASSDSAVVKAFCTIKRGRGLVREEAEVQMRVSDARAILSFPTVRKLEKRRITVPTKWEIDQYFGPLEGLVIAEIELPSADAVLPEVPSGLLLGPEVTGLKVFSNLLLSLAGPDMGPQIVKQAHRLFEGREA